MKRRHLLATATAAAGTLALGSAAASDWPGPRDRIQFVVPFNPGGSADRMARSLAQFMPQELGGTPISVVNRPGASGATGAAWFSQLRDDGSNFLVMQAIPFLANAILQLNAPIRWEDFQVLNVQWVDYAIVAVPRNSPHRSMKDLIEAIRARPGSVSTAVMRGSGAYIQHMILLDKLGLPRDAIRYVTYDGGGPVRTAVAGGHVDMTIVAAQGSRGISDHIRALAVVDDSPAPEWEAPLINEVLQEHAGVTMPLVSNYTVSVIAHRSFGQKHPERLARFLEAYRRTLERPDYRDFAEKGGFSATWRGPERSAEIVNAAYEALSAYASGGRG
ncbi:Bug family tripartite tricarboxylate transporter substrate binding protein [Crenalkalicoccus roseus]|uniref:Bug family tripartite tricarboxylate transporter substrate binding protein n=1 Tax=Crenalkalicoccus roseus TaxID=1485588 RepID=UPI001081891C|nr:tripartite tricarboxylate transporter substrate-binding protein [Crenalkalicoccus roseus]